MIITQPRAARVSCWPKTGLDAGLPFDRGGGILGSELRIALARPASLALLLCSSSRVAKFPYPSEGLEFSVVCIGDLGRCE
jgi:hypothetical protein